MNNRKGFSKHWYVASEFGTNKLSVEYSEDGSYSKNKPPVDDVWFSTKENAEEYLKTLRVNILKEFEESCDEGPNCSDESITKNEETNQNLFEQFLSEEENHDIKVRFEEYKNKKSNWLDWFVEHADFPLNEKDACRFAVNEFVKELKKTLHGITTGELTKGDLNRAFDILGIDK